MIALLLMSFALADCPADPLATALDSTSRMESAFASLDDAAFGEAQKALDEAIPCIRAPLTAADAATIHRGRALAAFFAGDNAGTARGLASVRVLQPSWTPPSSYMPPGHPLREIWNVTTADDTAVPAPAAPPGGWRVDGFQRAEIPAARAFLAQGMGSGGEVLSTTWAARPADLPAWDGPAAPAEPRKVNKGVRYGGTGVAVALLGAGAASLAMSSSAAAEIGEVPRDEVVATGRKANTLAGLGAGSCAAGVVVGVASWAVSF
jgi:hypothetical protein